MSVWLRRIGLGLLGLVLILAIAAGAVYAIGTARIKDIIRGDESMPGASAWFFGPYGIVLEEAELWPDPVPCRGALKFWEFPDQLIPR